MVINALLSVCYLFITNRKQKASLLVVERTSTHTPGFGRFA